MTYYHLFGWISMFFAVLASVFYFRACYIATHNSPLYFKKVFSENVVEKRVTHEKIAMIISGTPYSIQEAVDALELCDGNIELSFKYLESKRR